MVKCFVVVTAVVVVVLEKIVLFICVETKALPPKGSGTQAYSATVSKKVVMAHRQP